MNLANQRAASCLLCFGIAALSVAADAPISFQDRVKAREAVEKVYYNHRVWLGENTTPKPPFEWAVARALLEAKVVDDLKKCVALGRYWQRPLTSAQLQAEITRMAGNTKDPVTLRELFAALGNDPRLIAECLARPLLADRLIRDWYACDSRFHGGVRQRAERALREADPQDLQSWTDGEFYHVAYRLADKPTASEILPEGGSPVITLDTRGFAAMRARCPKPGVLMMREEAEAFIVLKTLSSGENEVETEALVFRKTTFDSWWARASAGLDADPSLFDESNGNDGYTISDPSQPESTCSDSWVSSALTCPVPDARDSHTAVWTGSEMIVWGGSGVSGVVNTGGRYNPATDTWTATSTGSNCPSPRFGSSAVWTGSEMIIWGGYGLATALELRSGTALNTGARYNPSTDAWMPTSTGANCPSARDSHTAVWSGTEMIVWGGEDDGGNKLNSGGRYNPSSDSWTPTSTGTNCPSGRINHAAAWLSAGMMVWGGADATGLVNTGARYLPLTDRWVATSAGINCPSPREGITLIWTGTVAVVWGGYGASGAAAGKSAETPLNSGGQYRLSTNSWTATSTAANCPSARAHHSAVWTGSVMIVWGGCDNNGSFNSGGRYNPSTDAWTATSTGANCPSARDYHTAVWTGSDMIVWGGDDINGWLANTGGRYTPSSDSWTPTSSGAGTPSARRYHSAVWTGAEMVIWGGNGPYGSVANSGGCYNPASDAWAATSTGAGCASARESHSAVWTGREMVVWGGYTPGVPPYYVNSGGRYDPSSDSWTPTAVTAACPAGRAGQTAIWTGREMIVWGGDTNGGYTNSGGRYDPISDGWTAASVSANCPSGRIGHTATWNGTEMIVWGGFDGNNFLNGGARYNPASDGWTGISNGANCASARRYHTAVWTGAEEVIWGGQDSSWAQVNTGGRYNPATDAWTAATASRPVPSARMSHTAVWTGNSMIVWGGDPITATGGIYKPYASVILSIPEIITCPPPYATLTSAPASSYQWLRNGFALPGATNRSYNAAASGNYRVITTDASGCIGTSADVPVTVPFCLQSEVSPQDAVFPARLVKEAAPATGCSLYFQKLDGAIGYNLYEGNVGGWYSHASASGNVCNLDAEDLGTGEMRAIVAPSAGNHYYLVTAFNAVAQGPSGFDSQGTQIPTAQSSCPP